MSAGGLSCILSQIKRILNEWSSRGGYRGVQSSSNLELTFYLGRNLNPWFLEFPVHCKRMTANIISSNKCIVNLSRYNGCRPDSDRRSTHLADRPTTAFIALYWTEICTNNQSVQMTPPNVQLTLHQQRMFSETELQIDVRKYTSGHNGVNLIWKLGCRGRSGFENFRTTLS